jgi:hypothetical protein
MSSYSSTYASGGSTSLRQFVPNYQTRSDFLPGTVREGSNPTTADVVTIALRS